jgi:hypothetical protein
VNGHHYTPQQQADRLGEQLRLAQEIADDCARSDIESFCVKRSVDGLDWFDTAIRFDDSDFARSAVRRAVTYLRLRGRVTSHPTQQALVRFP